MAKSTQRATPELSDNAITVLERRYLIKDDDGRPTEGPEELFWRVASTVAAPDAKYGASKGALEELAEAFYGIMTKRVWMPNSPTLMNAGRPLGQLSACFVLPVEDSLSNGESGIYDTLRHMALVHQSGGGTGFGFSRLRPTNSVVRSTMGVASGPVSFMSLYDASTEVVKQGGTRRGANMGILRVDHPDILQFITCKDDTTKITNFNISVAATDAFMEAVERDEEYDLVDPHTNEVVDGLNAREVFSKIIHGAWKTGEPGVFFIDKANYYNPVPHLGSYEATNPCGEQPLLPYDVCNLGSVNVGVFVKDGELDWDALRKTVRLCTHFLETRIYRCLAIDNLTMNIESAIHLFLFSHLEAQNLQTFVCFTIKCKPGRVWPAVLQCLKHLGHLATDITARTTFPDKSSNTTHKKFLLRLNLYAAIAAVKNVITQCRENHSPGRGL
ncbi:MAG: hypothetical protein IH811_08275 [Proteobacteria bacterium]|nr:hypothetical protein [Pseudomonadota bacterium]